VGGLERRVEAEGQAPRVLVALAEPGFRRAVLELLTEDGVPVVGGVTTGSGAVTAAMAPDPERPDVVVVGGRLGGHLPVWDVIRQIRDAVPEVGAVALLDDAEGPAAARCRRAGAAVVLDRAGNPAALLSAVRLATAGRPLATRSLDEARR